MGATSPPHDAEATAEELPEQPGDAPAPQPAASTDIVPRARRSEVIRPLDADQLVQSFSDYQALLPKLLVDSDYQEAERGKRFVKKSGWRKIATAFDLDVVLVREVVVERDETGQPVRAKAWARAIAPSGRSMDGDGYCSADEPRFRDARGRQKLENDLCATATTRAKNRAISDLVGMGEVSAEEVDAGPAGGGGELPPWAAAISGDGIDRLRRALAYLLDDEPRGDRVERVGYEITEACGGIIPTAALGAIRTLAIVHKRHADSLARSDPRPAAEAAEAAAAAIASEHADEPEPTPEELAASAARHVPDDDIPF